MFTGVVQGLGMLQRASASEVFIAVPESLSKQLAPGASIAVNGVCLTVREQADAIVRADVSRETASRTTFGSLRSGMRVNLELALAANARFDGHLVLGHVDAVGRLQAIYRECEGWAVILGYPLPFAQYLAEKGSVAVDGISLTPYGLDGNTFRCSVIRETYERTTLQDRNAGDPVNLEFDVLAKYVERMMSRVHRD